MEVEEDKLFEQNILYFTTVALGDLKQRIETVINPNTPQREVVLSHAYFGGAERYEDIDIFDFYAKHGPHMPVIEPIIREMLGQPTASYAPEKIFSGGKFVLNDYRTCIDPARAENLILSAARFKIKLFTKFLPKLPIDGVEDDADAMLELDDALEQANESLRRQRERDGECDDASDDSDDEDN